MYLRENSSYTREERKEMKKKKLVCQHLSFLFGKYLYPIFQLKENSQKKKKSKQSNKHT